MPELIGLSLHAALGGRALWLVNASSRNSAEPQTAAALAGLRLQRTLGGFNGIIALDDKWSAFFLRLNEIAIVATFESYADAVGAQRCTEAARTALFELCGSPKISDVTLANLARRGAEVQLALRKCVTGAGRLIGAAVGRIDLAAQLLSPDQPSDDRASKDIRSSNDITAISTDLAIDAAALRRSDAFSESIRSLRIPGTRLPLHSPAAAPIQIGQARAGQRNALLSLLPRILQPPPSEREGGSPSGKEELDAADDGFDDDAAGRP